MHTQLKRNSKSIEKIKKISTLLITILKVKCTRIRLMFLAYRREQIYRFTDICVHVRGTFTTKNK